MKTFLEVTEHLTNLDSLPDGFRLYEVDGYIVWTSKECVEHLQSLQDIVQNFVDGCPHCETGGDEVRKRGGLMASRITIPEPVRVTIQTVDSYMRLHYGIGLDAMEITDTPGYWQDKEPQIHRGHPLHSCLGCSGPFKGTYTYFDSGRENGRFVSRTKSWQMIRDSVRRADSEVD